LETYIYVAVGFVIVSCSLVCDYLEGGGCMFLRNVCTYVPAVNNLLKVVWVKLKGVLLDSSLDQECRVGRDAYMSNARET
jgi:hypothetical protein